MKEKIISIHSVKEVDGMIYADITTSHHGRLVQRPHKYTLAEWAEIMEKREGERK